MANKSQHSAFKWLIYYFHKGLKELQLWRKRNPQGQGVVIAKQLQEPSQYLLKYLNILRQIMFSFVFIIIYFLLFIFWFYYNTLFLILFFIFSSATP